MTVGLSFGLSGYYCITVEAGRMRCSVEGYSEHNWILCVECYLSDIRRLRRTNLMRCGVEGYSEHNWILCVECYLSDIRRLRRTNLMRPKVVLR